MEILNLKLRSRLSGLVWEHALKTILGFAGIYASMFFIPILIGTEIPNGLTAKLVHLFVENQEAVFVLCGLVALLWNVQVLLKNGKRNLIHRIELDTNTALLTVWCVSMMSNKTVEGTVQLANLRIEKVKRKSFFEFSHSTFYKLHDGDRLVGVMDESSDLWSNYKHSSSEIVKTLIQMKTAYK